MKGDGDRGEKGEEENIENRDGDEDGSSLQQTLLEELRLLYDELGVPPRTIDMGKHGGFSPALYSKEFGSWKEALEEAGIDGEPHRPPEGTDPDFDSVRESEEAPQKAPSENGTADDEEASKEGLDEYQRLILENAERKEGVPTPDDLRRRGHPVNEIIDEYGTWKNALGSVGIETPERTHTKEQKRRTNGDEGALLEEVKKYKSIHGKGPSRKDVEGTGWMSPIGEYEEAFGTVWGAVDTLRENGKDEHTDEDGPSEEELVSELKRYYLRNGEVPTREDVRNSGTLSELSSYIDAFGDVRSAVRTAGLEEKKG